MCVSLVLTLQTLQKKLPGMVVVAKIKAVTLVDTDIMAHSLFQVPVANTQLSNEVDIKNSSSKCTFLQHSVEIFRNSCHSDFT